MEIMIVITIIGLILGVGGPVLMNRLNEARKGTAKQEIHTFKQAIESFEMDTHVLPQTLKELIKGPADEKLAHKWKGPYYNKKTIPKDPWGKVYQYRVTSDNSEHPYELFSYGGTKGKSQDKKDKISVWHAED
jgi:general secretion pathway protein G